MEMAGSADLFGWVTSSAQELEGGRALLRPLAPGVFLLPLSADSTVSLKLVVAQPL